MAPTTHKCVPATPTHPSHPYTMGNMKCMVHGKGNWNFNSVYAIDSWTDIFLFCTTNW